MRTAVVVAVCAGCSFAPQPATDGALGRTDSGGRDSLARDGAGADGSVDANRQRTTPCMQRWHENNVAFETPKLLSELGSGANPQSDPFVSFDETTIYFVATGPTGGSAEIYMATRASVDHPFGTPTPFLPADGSGNQSKLSMTQDNRIFVVASDRAGNGNLDLFLSSASVPGVYSTPDTAELQSIDDSDNQYDPSITLDGLSIFYAPDTGGQQHIYVSSRDTLGDDFQSKQIVQTVNGSGAADEDPALSADGSVLVFSSHRNPTSVDIYYSTRDVPPTSPDAGFGSAMPVTGVNSDQGDGDPMLGADGCRLYFESNRSGSNEIYEATMTLP